jgi:uncharacterized protein (TIGR03435 family)
MLLSLMFTVSLQSGAAAQPVSAGTTFEAASVKVAQPGKYPQGAALPKAIVNAARVTYPAITLTDMIMVAFRLKSFQVIGPQWMSVSIYSVAASLPPGATSEQLPQMMRALLVDRFGLKVHEESRVETQLALVVAKSGVKVSAEDPDTPTRLVMAPIGNTQAKIAGKASFEMVADRLAILLHRPIVDSTGLGGIFPVDLDIDSGDVGVGDSPADFQYGVGVALKEKMGLELQSRKGPMRVLVIDHAEKLPTEN